MKLTIAAPSLTKPTYQTLQEFATKKFNKLDRFWKNIDEDAKEVRIGVEKIRDVFEMKVEIFSPEHLVVKSKDRDIRRLVDTCYDEIKVSLTRTKERKLDLSKFKKKFKGFRDRVFRR